MNDKGLEYDNELNDKQNKHASERALDNFEFDYVFRCYDLECLKKNAELISMEKSFDMTVEKFMPGPDWTDNS